MPLLQAAVTRQLFINDCHMKTSTLIGLALAAPALLSAQSKIDMAGLRMLSDFKAQATFNEPSRAGGKLMPLVTSKFEVPSRTMALVTLESESDIAALEAAGAEIVSQRGDMVIVDMPLERAETIAELKQVKNLSFGSEARPLLNYARRDSYVNPIQEGTDDLPQAYNGTGVVTGLMDTGMDPNHINFTGRVSRVWVINPGSGDNTVIQSYTTPERIAEFTTEKSSATHGTHVLGIMSGAYKGAGRYGFFGKTSGNYSIGTTKIPYYGVATGADIAIGCGSFNDVCILKAGDLVTEYAKSVGRPAVFNLSLGNNIGPHDGTDPTSRYLAKIGEEAIVHISAGNEGADLISFEQTFSASSPEYRTLLTGVDNSGSYISTTSGTVDLWGADNTVFEVTFVVLDKTTGSIAYSYTLDRNTEGQQISIANPNYAGENINSAEFDATMTGYVLLRSNVATYNNRYQTYIYTNLTPKSSNYVAGVIVKGKDGVKVSGFCSGTLAFYNHGLQGWNSGSAINSANGMACGDNVLAIGAYNTRNRLPFLSGYLPAPGTEYVTGICSFSSYGVEPNGRSIPDFCAPGQMVISSISSYYADLYGAEPTAISAQTPYPAQSGKRVNYWEQMSGTSMASPFAAGVTALLLQADPTLTVNDLREIYTSTAIRDEQVTSAPNQVQWGAGKVDALAALKAVLKIDSSIGSVRADDDARLMITRGAGSLSVFVAGENSLDVALYTPSGVMVKRAVVQSDEAVVETSGLATGVYIVTIKGEASNYSRKITIK